MHILGITGDELRKAKSFFYCPGNRSSFPFFQFTIQPWQWPLSLKSVLFLLFIHKHKIFNSSKVSIYTNCPVSVKLLLGKQTNKTNTTPKKPTQTNKKYLAIQWMSWMTAYLTWHNNPKSSSSLLVNYQFPPEKIINIKHSALHYQNLIHPKLNLMWTYFDTDKVTECP